MTTRYTTRSGSVYVVRTSKYDGAIEVQRLKLGQHHHDKGPEQVARRIGDSVGLTVWRKCEHAVCAGIGDRLRIKFGADDTITTSPVFEIVEAP